jgi:large subunit ribosomal protein L29
MAKGLAAADLRGSTEEELDNRLAEAKIELFNLRFQAATGQLESHGRLRAVRKEIARIYTVKRERELGIVSLAQDDEADEPAEEVSADE